MLEAEILGRLYIANKDTKVSKKISMPVLLDYMTTWVSKFFDNNALIKEYMCVEGKK